MKSVLFSITFAIFFNHLYEVGLIFCYFNKSGLFENIFQSEKINYNHINIRSLAENQPNSGADIIDSLITGDTYEDERKWFKVAMPLMKYILYDPDSPNSFEQYYSSQSAPTKCTSEEVKDSLKDNNSTEG